MDTQKIIETRAQSHWSWLAAALTVQRHYGASNPYAQCELASLLLPECSDCCDDPAPCNKEGDLKDALNYIRHFSGTYDWIDPGQLGEHARAGRPVVMMKREGNGTVSYYVVFWITDRMPESVDWLVDYGDVQTGEFHSQVRWGGFDRDFDLAYLTKR